MTDRNRVREMERRDASARIQTILPFFSPGELAALADYLEQRLTERLARGGVRRPRPGSRTRARKQRVVR